MIIIDNIDQTEDREEWLKLRGGVISGTGFKKCMTKGKGNSPSKVRQDYTRELATERITGRHIDGFGGTWEMRQGKEREPQARALYEIETGNTIKEAAFVFLDEDRKIGISPDGLIMNQADPMNVLGTWENKSPKLSTHVGYLLEHQEDPLWYPLEYKAQIHGQLWVTGAQWCDFTSFCPDSNIEMMRVRIPRDDEYIAEIQSAVAIFMVELDRLERVLREMK